MKNVLFFIVSLPVVVFFVVTGFPFGSLFHTAPPELAAGGRLLLSLLLLGRLWRSFPALPLIFGHRRFLTTTVFFPQGLYYTKLFLAVMLLAGVFTDIVAILLFLAHIVVFTRSRYYSIEEIVFQNFLLHLPFMGAGAIWSVDAWAGFDFGLYHPLMWNSFFVSTAIVMLSGGWEKLKSPLWRRGQGAQAFFGLPHLVWPRWHFVQKYTRLLWFAGSVVLVAECGLLFAAFHYYSLLVGLLLLLGFSISLFVFVDLSFIGQVVTVNLLLFLGALLGGPQAYPSLSASWQDFILSYEASIPLAVNVFSLCMVAFPVQARRIGLATLQHLLSGITSEVAVFTERHQVGLFTYRLYLEGNGRAVPVLEAFDEQGFPGKMQRLHPRYYQAAMYPVTDYCLGVHAYGTASTVKLEQVIDLMYAGLRHGGKAEGTVVLKVKLWDDGDTVAAYRDQAWAPLGACVFTKQTARFTLLNVPPRPAVSHRSV